MDEKILIKSQIDKKAKSIMIGIILTFFAIAAILFLYLCGEKETILRTTHTRYWHAFHGDGLALAILIIASISLIFGIISLIIFWAYSKCELTITDKNAKGKTLFGKEVVLPLYMISAYSTKKLFSTITIATSSGITKFSLIGNYAEIGNILSGKINERQENTTNEAKATVAQTNAMDDIIKLKSMLDSGIITQEEFDAKKKQLLGL